jgi:hypothetical protein
MGNRACVVFTNEKQTEISPVCYLHWNGGAESIYAFLDEMERRQCGRVDYAAARFAHIVADFMDQDEAGSSSLGMFNGPKKIDLETMEPFAHTADDNGVFVVILGEKRLVRRFVLASGNGKYGVTELSKREVEQERREAYRHEYIVGNEHGHSIPATFARLRPKISQYG